MPIPGFPVGDGDSDGMPQRSGGSSLQRRSAGQDSLSAPLILQPDPPPPENKWVVESLLFFVMGMSGWWTINAIQWAESPIFVERTPERQAITNLLMVTCQIGNVFPFVYKGVFSKQTQARILPASIMVCQIIAIATGIVVALGWQVTVELPDGGRHSIVLLLCTVVAGGVGTLSNVTYWALCTRYDGSHCTSAMSTGMAVGGVISTGAALTFTISCENTATPPLPMPPAPTAPTSTRAPAPLAGPAEATTPSVWTWTSAMASTAAAPRPAPTV